MGNTNHYLGKLFELLYNLNHDRDFQASLRIQKDTYTKLKELEMKYPHYAKFYNE